MIHDFFFRFGSTVSEIFVNILLAYLILSLLLTIYAIVWMYMVEHKTNDTKSGRKRMLQLQKEGRFLQMPVYTMEEIEEDGHLEDVRLMRFSADNDEIRPFVMILPGGGYAHCCTREEGYPVAAALNKLGYTAFILEYRTGFKCSPFGPMEDLGNALKLIEDNADRWGVTMKGYALMGFSAGGNLAGIFASNHHGYKDFDLPKPGAVILGYPWTCVNDWLKHPYWNMWIGLLGIWLSNRGAVHMFGLAHMFKGRKALDVHSYIEDDYPATYMFSGGRDVLVPASRHADVFAECLEDHNVRHVYQQFFGLPHGIGLGKGTKAEKWLSHAVDFWQEAIKDEQ